MLLSNFALEIKYFAPAFVQCILFSVLCHCRLRGQEAVFGHMSHMIMYEQGGVAQVNILFMFNGPMAMVCVQKVCQHQILN